jgi:hypothetical protein
VKAYPPCGWPDNHWFDAGIKGGNPEFGRELRRAELNMDRNTNPLQNCRHSSTGLAELISLTKMVLDGEPEVSNRFPDVFSYPSRRTMGSYVQRQTETRNEVTMVRLSGSLPEQVVSRMPYHGRIASEANAFGKAEGYADGGTVRWKIEVKVGVRL